MNIAVIDNWISPTGLRERTGRTILAMRVEQEGCVFQEASGPTNSHGTICSSILADCLPEHATMIGFSCSNDDGKAEIQKVCRALDDCLKNPPACISMSIGSENWLETDELCEMTRKLVDAGTKIFAACANNGHIAFPAAYPWVTGVRYVPGLSGLYREEASPVGCNIVVGDFTTPTLETLARQNEFFKCRTNSMAAPYALGRMISQGLTLEGLPLWANLQLTQEPSPTELPMPAVALRGPLAKQEAVLEILQQESYQAALLTDRWETDWQKMIVHVDSGSFFQWLRPLEEAGILLLDMEGKLAPMERYADCGLDLNERTAVSAYREILDSFGTEECGNEKA